MHAAAVREPAPGLWISTQPIEEPERARQLQDVIEWIGHERLLIATDYPHWDFDDPARPCRARCRTSSAARSARRTRGGSTGSDGALRRRARRGDPAGRAQARRVRGARRGLQRQGRVLRAARPLPAPGRRLCRGKLVGLVESDEPGRYRYHRGRARSSAARGTAGSSTCAPASQCDPKRIWVKSYPDQRRAGRAARRGRTSRDLRGQRRGRLRGHRGVTLRVARRRSARPCGRTACLRAAAPRPAGSRSASHRLRAARRRPPPNRPRPGEDRRRRVAVEQRGQVAGATRASARAAPATADPPSGTGTGRPRARGRPAFRHR